MSETRRINRAWVLEQVRRVQEAQGDPEVAHSLEDDLRQAVLRAIASGAADDPRECARLCLLTEHLDFPRWSA